jgi:hypothetical protein
MEFQLIQNDYHYVPAKLIEPTMSGYLHIAAEVQPSSIPFLPASAEKSKLLMKLKTQALQLEQLDQVERVSVYDASAIPPFDKYSGAYR